MAKSDIQLKSWNYDENKMEVLGEVSPYLLGKSMSAENFAEVISNFLNSGMKDYGVGYEVGKIEQSDHRTLQGSLVRFCLGVIIGISEQDYTDARNEKVVELGKKIARMIKDGELNMGYMI